MSMSDSLGPITPSTTHVFRPRWSTQWTVGQVLAKRRHKWLVHYREPGYRTITRTGWFPPSRRAERRHD